MSPPADQAARCEETADVVIIGGGVVGLAILRAVTQGAARSATRCILVESSPDLLSQASGSNSGIACTGVDASPGTLERCLIRDSISQIRGFCREMNLPTRECGSLVCLWPWDEAGGEAAGAGEARSGAGGAGQDDERLVAIADESWGAGDSHARILSPAQVLGQDMEPSLSGSCLGAVHIPGEVVLDPWLFGIALASQAREMGGIILTNWRYSAQGSTFHRSADGDFWLLAREQAPEPCEDPSGCSGAPSVIRARVVINATGIQSDVNQAGTAGAPSPSWEARPRRGQYRIFSPSPAGVRLTRPIQPVPTQRTKGIFVFSSLYDHIVVGPTATDQESRDDVEPDAEVAGQLAQHVRRIIPQLETGDSNVVGEYVGIRPGTNHRDYQIHLYPEKRWITAAGIRSTGLTASLGIGQYVARSLLPVVLPDAHRGDSCAADGVAPPACTPLPPVGDLVRDFHARGDGCVRVNGHVYRVTHPITRLGWLARSGMAQCS